MERHLQRITTTSTTTTRADEARSDGGGGSSSSRQGKQPMMRAVKHASPTDEGLCQDLGFHACVAMVVVVVVVVGENRWL